MYSPAAPLKPTSSGSIYSVSQNSTPFLSSVERKAKDEVSEMKYVQLLINKSLLGIKHRRLTFVNHSSTRVSWQFWLSMTGEEWILPSASSENNVFVEVGQ